MPLDESINDENEFNQFIVSEFMAIERNVKGS